jgi:hypothetical protein
MKNGLNMLNPFGRKAMCIILILLTCIGFAFGSAGANTCEGGADCPFCAEQPHGHIPGTAAGMEKPDCPPYGQNSPCGFEAGRQPDEFHGIVCVVRSNQQLYSGIFAAALNEWGQTLFPKEFFPRFLLSDSGGTASIFLCNQALLC